MEQPKQDSVIEECKFAYSEDYNQDKQGKFFLKRVSATWPSGIHNTPLSLRIWRGISII